MPSGIIQGTFGFIYTLASPAVDGSEAIKKTIQTLKPT